MSFRFHVIIIVLIFSNNTFLRLMEIIQILARDGKNLPLKKETK